MEFYLIAVIVLLALAIGDLMVGVSNDAVNFLNSAIGSKVASWRTIMIVASLGIFIGATFSSGMMEIARKGIFNPGLFTMADIMVVFLAVMITDVILLDVFNTFGLPTSTTVSIVFELLGAAVLVALIKIVQQGDSLSVLGDYINTSSALAIIIGIVLSVGIAFTVGALVQYVSRLLFSFQYERRMRTVGAIWSGFALTALSYFLVFKGLKGASFVSGAFLGWIEVNTWPILGASLVVWTLVMYGLLLLKVNILRIIVLFGTFGLAMAFAGNDLVNFIGVPIAGLESFLAWNGTGEAADSFFMTALAEPVRTSTWLLLLAGLIMVVTLWLSRKARTVTETEVNLGRQEEGLERFAPNTLARAVVRGSRNLGTAMQRVTPASWRSTIESNFDTEHAPNDPDQPAFDLVRASVNLTVAALLIAVATSFRLPLSTTYVSFMVAMGASLSDRAWGRESAVYRVSGVLNVIGGWFLTAFAAFTVAGIFAVVLFYFQLAGLAVLVAVATFSVVRGIAIHRRRKQDQRRREAQERRAEIAWPDAVNDVTERIAQSLRAVQEAYTQAFDGLLAEDRAQLRRAHNQMNTLKKENEALRAGLHSVMQRAGEPPSDVSLLYLTFYDHTQDLLQSAGFAVEVCREHVLNVHQPPTDPQRARLRSLCDRVGDYLHHVADQVEARDFADIRVPLQQKDEVLGETERLFEAQVEAVKANGDSRKNNLLYLRLLLESKDLVAISARFLKYYHRNVHPVAEEAAVA